VGARAFDLEERLEPVLRLKHVKALEADVLTEDGTQLGIIVDDEHGLRGGVLRKGLLPGVTSCSTRGEVGTDRRHRQPEGGSGALAALDGDRRVGLLLHERSNDGEADPGPLRFGGVERRPDLGEGVWRNARPRVRDLRDDRRGATMVAQALSVNCPPPVSTMACTAFMARFTKTCMSALRSPTTLGSLGGTWRTMLTSCFRAS